VSKSLGFSIRIFLRDGTLDGPNLLEESNWSGIVTLPKWQAPRYIAAMEHETKRC
jgi:hypothetical protein